MHGPAGFLSLLLVFLVAAVIAVPVFRRLGLGAILGYLAAGVAIGPDGLSLVPDPDDVLAASCGRDFSPEACKEEAGRKAGFFVVPGIGRLSRPRA